MNWKLTVIENDIVIFVGNATSADEASECAAEAARLRPTAIVMVTAPTGTVRTIHGADVASAKTAGST